ncbi:MAG: hypothetical protein K2N48_08595 [Muribaculaceae bacterium]|nr:hypothetical protein [Muribaculaceae bacterium]
METKEIIQFVSAGFDKAKAGAAVEVYASIVNNPDMRVLPLKSHYPFGWIIYYALHQSPAHAIRERKQLLANYLSLNVAKPHKLHSMILTEAFRLYKDASDAATAVRLKSLSKQESEIPAFSIVKFVDLWNFAHIRPTDWNRKEHEGKLLPSTVEKLITHYTDELYSKRLPASEEFIGIINQALVAYPPTANLFAQRAQIHELAGEKVEAVEMLRNAILASSTKFHLWSRLANLITDKDDLRLKVSLNYKALRCPGQEDFKGKIHLQLAAALAEGGAFPQAKWELDYVKNLYGSKGWNLPRLYKETEKKMPSDIEAADPSGIYRKVEHMAEDFIYESLPEIPVRKTYHKPGTETTDRYGKRRPGQTAWRVTDAEGNNYWFNPGRYGIPEELPADTQLAVKIFGGKVVKARAVITIVR